MTLDSIKKRSDFVINAIKNNNDICPVIPARFLDSSPYIFDFSENNKDLSLIDINNDQQFTDYIDKSLHNSGCVFGAGGYGEDRIIYRRSDLFAGDTSLRSVHLGIDIWMPAHTPIYYPMPALVHSFQDNKSFGDYGPTIILEHKIDDVKFYTLYGHLSRSSLTNIQVGMHINKRQQVVTLGSYAENGR